MQENWEDINNQLDKLKRPISFSTGVGFIHRESSDKVVGSYLQSNLQSSLEDSVKDFEQQQKLYPQQSKQISGIDRIKNLAEKPLGSIADVFKKGHDESSEFSQEQFVDDGQQIYADPQADAYGSQNYPDSIHRFQQSAGTDGIQAQQQYQQDGQYQQQQYQQGQAFAGNAQQYQQDAQYQPEHAAADTTQYQPEHAAADATQYQQQQQQYQQGQQFQQPQSQQHQQPARLQHQQQAAQPQDFSNAQIDNAGTQQLDQNFFEEQNEELIKKQKKIELKKQKKLAKEQAKMERLQKKEAKKAAKANKAIGQEESLEINLDWEESNKKEKKKFPIKIAAAILALLVAIAAALLIFRLCTWEDPSAVSLTAEERINCELPAGNNETVISIRSNIIKKADRNDALANIINNPGNNVDQKVSITLDDSGDVIYASNGAIAPGKKIEYIPLNKKLEPGSYSGTAIFECFSSDKHESVGKVSAKVTLIIEQ